MNEESKYSSRKLAITIAMFLIFIICPLFISKIEILKEVFSAVLIAGLGYSGANVVSLMADRFKEVKNGNTIVNNSVTGAGVSNVDSANIPGNSGSNSGISGAGMAGGNTSIIAGKPVTPPQESSPSPAKPKKKA